MFGHFIKHNHLCIFCNLHAASNKQLLSRSIAASSFKSKNHSFFSLDFNAQKKQNILTAICLFLFNGPLCVCFFALTSVYCMCVSEWERESEWDREWIILRPLTRRMWFCDWIDHLSRIENASVLLQQSHWISVLFSSYVISSLLIRNISTSTQIIFFCIEISFSKAFHLIQNEILRLLLVIK